MTTSRNSGDLGDQLEEYALRLRRLAAHLERASEAERQRLSRELHDELGQQVTAMRYVLSFIRQRFHREPAQAYAQLAEVEDIVARLMTGLRHLVADLRPPVLDDRGLVPALEWLVQRTGATGGIACELDAQVDGTVELDPDLTTTTFRIVQEALANVVRHAHARRALVRLRIGPEGVQVHIEDDGRGMDPRAARQAGMGLFGLSERARAHGGQIEIRSEPGDGTTLSVHLRLSEGTP